MISKALILLGVVVCSQAFYLFPHQPLVHTKVIPIVKHVRQPVYIEKVVRVPHYIERAIPVPYPSGSAGGAVAGAGAGAIAGLSGDIGLTAKIEDADTVNIQTGISGAIPAFSNDNGLNNNGFDNNGFDNGFDENGLGLGRSIGTQGLVGQGQPRIRVSQTSISSPSARISQPQFGHNGHGIRHLPKKPSHLPASIGHF